MVDKGNLPSSKQICIVVPTIFSRPAFLPIALDSIANQQVDCKIIVSAPKNMHAQISNLLPTDAVLLEERPNSSLAEKINAAFLEAPESVKYLGWLGDDDALQPGALTRASQTLDENLHAVMAFGACDYIAPGGEKIGSNKSGQWAARMLNFGPDLIPQPGALWRRDAFERVGGLSSEFDLAFDYDFFLKLKAHGELIYIPATLASFRWHPDSLSVKSRGKSVLEASRVRRKHYKGLMRTLWPLWEPSVIFATWLAGKVLGLRLLVTTR